MRHEVTEIELRRWTAVRNRADDCRGAANEGEYRPAWPCSERLGLAVRRSFWWPAGGAGLLGGSQWVSGQAAPLGLDKRMIGWDLPDWPQPMTDYSADGLSALVSANSERWPSRRCKRSESCA